MCRQNAFLSSVYWAALEDTFKCKWSPLVRNNAHSFHWCHLSVILDLCARLYPEIGLSSLCYESALYRSLDLLSRVQSTFAQNNLNMSFPARKQSDWQRTNQHAFRDRSGGSTLVSGQTEFSLRGWSGSRLSPGCLALVFWAIPVGRGWHYSTPRPQEANQP